MYWRVRYEGFKNNFSRFDRFICSDNGNRYNCVQKKLQKKLYYSL